MKFVQQRYKAILAFLSTGGSSLFTFYQVNQNVTLKQAVTSLIAALIGGAIVHQVKNAP